MMWFDCHGRPGKVFRCATLPLPARLVTAPKPSSPLRAPRGFGSSDPSRTPDHRLKAKLKDKEKSGGGEDGGAEEKDKKTGPARLILISQFF